MSSLIEQAAQRLAQLREAGVEIPEPDNQRTQAKVGAAAAVHAAAVTPPVPPALAPSVTPSVTTASAVPAPSAPISRRVDLDMARLAAAGIVTPSAARSVTAEQYRVVKRPLIRNATGQGASVLKHGNLIMVTSALAGEGKSFTALNLAMSIAAELDHTVMLVDADVARPSLPRMLGIEDGPGLLDVLDGTAAMSDVLLRTNVDKLTVLRSGSFHPKATELLASEAMRQLLDDIATRYADRIVIFDSPPLLLTTEARVLATHMGQVVVVVQADKTLQSEVQHALATIESCPVRLLLLNQARHAAEGGYGYGYGYAERYREQAGAAREPQPAASA